MSNSEDDIVVGEDLFSIPSASPSHVEVIVVQQKINDNSRESKKGGKNQVHEGEEDENDDDYDFADQFRRWPNNSLVEGDDYDYDDNDSFSYSSSRNRRRGNNNCDDIVVDEEEDDEELAFCFPAAFDSAKEHAGEFLKRVWDASWKATHFYSLPEWLQDNDYLHSGYRPPLPTFRACFTSIFRLHNETGNIWSHMLGCVAFLGIAAFFLTRSSDEVQLQEKLVFSTFFAGAITCLGLSFAFHTMNCHSERVGKLFCKLDYVGITLLIVGSFIPWLFYCFYCRPEPKIVYTAAIIVLGSACVFVSLCDKFSQPLFRPIRAGLFFGLALSGVVPSIHYLVTDGYWSAVNEAHFGWLLLMAGLYVFGTFLYAMRIPERFFPGKFDIWFQSHQLFHLFVVVAAFVHYHGISEMAIMRLQGASCQEREQMELLMSSS